MEYFDRDNYLFGGKPGHLIQGEVNGEHFKLLIEISNIRSKKIIYALEEHFVSGRDIKSLCEEYKMSTSYFWISLRRFQEVSHCVARMCEFYK